MQVEFTPTQAGQATGLLTFTDGAGTQTAELSGIGEAAPTDILNPHVARLSRDPPRASSPPRNR